jgi:hypothetical protein
VVTVDQIGVTGFEGREHIEAELLEQGRDRRGALQVPDQVTRRRVDADEEPVVLLRPPDQLLGKRPSFGPDLGHGLDSGHLEDGEDELAELGQRVAQGRVIRGGPSLIEAHGRGR